MKAPLKVGFCIAYDWRLLEFSLPLVYSEAAIICLSIDKDRIGWAGELYPFDEQEFHKLIRRLDVENKIRIYEHDFHSGAKTPRENEVFQRTQMSKFLGNGGWHVQLDCDEYFLNFKGFVAFLQNSGIRPSEQVNICCPLVTIFKQVEEGFLYINPEHKMNLEFIQIASQTPSYEHGRRNGHFNIYTGFKIIHQSWARDETEIANKLNNWGHKLDFDGAEYLKRWKDLTIENFQGLTNFHPIKAGLWPSLSYGPGRDVEAFMKNFNESEFVSLSPTEMAFRNSRFLARLRSLFSR